MKTAAEPSAVPFSFMDVLPAAAALAVLALLGLWNYLLFHSLIELFAILVSTGAFLMTWNVRKRMESGFLLFVATAFAGVSVLDTAHFLAYRGMAIFPDFSDGQARQLWLASRSLQALSLLAAPLFATRPAPAGRCLFAYAVIDAVVLLEVFRPWPFLPPLPAGLVPEDRFLLDYSICGILLLAMGLFWLMRQWLDRAVLRFMLVAMAALVASDLCLSGHVYHPGAINMIGHLLKAVAFYLTYKALVEAGLVRPFEVLFLSASQSRAQVLESEERFRTLSAATFEGIAITENGRIVDVNEQLLDMLRRPREAMIGEPASAFLVPEDRERVLQNIREGLEGHIDHRMIRPDGTEFHVEARGKMVHFKNRTVRVTAIRDVTERRQVEESLREARNAAVRAARDLARSNRDLQQFAHVTSHDLKEPLRMVSGFMGLLKERYAERLDDKGRECVQLAGEAAQRMQRLIDDLLEYARVGWNAPAEATPMGEALDAAAANLGVAFRESGARLTRDPMPTLEVNRGEMIQLFQNLVGNAVKFRSAAAPVVHAGARLRNGIWEFTVRDNGIGIDPAYLNRLFTIFQRLHPPEDYPGSGVGLAICKKIVEKYGGDIRAESEPGKGAVFTFTLPEAGEGIS